MCKRGISSTFYETIIISSAVSSTNFGSIVIFASCVINRPLVLSCHDSSLSIFAVAFVMHGASPYGGGGGGHTRLVLAFAT